MTPLQAARQHPKVVAGLLATAGLAWWWTVERIAGMDGGPGTDLGTLGWFTGSWVVMMAAMMLPETGGTPAALWLSTTFRSWRRSYLRARVPAINVYFPRARGDGCRFRGAGEGP